MKLRIRLIRLFTVIVAFLARRIDMREGWMNIRPFIFYRDSSKRDPYLWPVLVCSQNVVGDACGCRRDRLRKWNENDERWVMYFECIEELLPGETMPRPKYLFIVKLYAPVHPDETHEGKQTKLNQELAWLARACEHSAPQSTLQQRGCGTHEPEHMKAVV